MNNTENKNNSSLVERKHALITGASYGIGYSFAKKLAELNFDLILVARSSERLKNVKKELEDKYKINVFIRVGDLCNQKTCYSLYNEFKEHDLDLLINNAGFGDFGLFRSADLERDVQMINLNIVALQILTNLFVKKFYEADSGIILNISSIAGGSPGPYLATYSATKAYVTTLSMAIDYELKRSGSKARVITLAPGRTLTQFTHNSKNTYSKDVPTEITLKDIDDAFDNKRVNKMTRTVTADQLVDDTLNELFTTQKSLLIFGNFNKAFCGLGRISTNAALKLRYNAMSSATDKATANLVKKAEDVQTDDKNLTKNKVNLNQDQEKIILKEKKAADVQTSDKIILKEKKATPSKVFPKVNGANISSSRRSGMSKKVRMASKSVAKPFKQATKNKFSSANPKGFAGKTKKDK